MEIDRLISLLNLLTMSYELQIELGQLEESKNTLVQIKSTNEKISSIASQNAINRMGGHY